MAERILQAEFESEAIRRELAGVFPPEIRRLPLITNIPSPHQIKKVEAGETEEIFKFTLPDDCLGFILRVANTYWEDDIVKWRIDGRLFDIGNIRRVIGTINAPYEVCLGSV